MGRVLKNLSAAVIVCLLVSVAVWADPADSPEVSAEFARGMRLLRDSHYADAWAALNALAANNQSSANIDLFLFNAAKAAYYIPKPTEALNAFAAFETRFPQSPYRAYASLFVGNVYYETSKFSAAVDKYIEAFSNSRDARLTETALRSLEALTKAHPEIKLRAQQFASIPEEKRCALIKRITTRLIEQQRLDEVSKLSALCAEAKPAVSRAADSAKFGSEVQVAVAVPLSGELQSFGEDIYNGSIIAADFYHEETGRQITLVPFDTKGDPITAARTIGQLANSSVDAVIGPLTSDEASVASASLSCSFLPLIAPAATDAGLTLLSQSAFQLSPNIELQGIAMAEYAVRTLRADSAVVITSTGVDNLAIANAFVERFRKLGGTVVAMEYYRPRDREFAPYIHDAKSILLGAHHDTSDVYLGDTGDTLEVDAAPAHVDCIFTPGNADQLRLLLPQVKFYNLQGALLGSDGWGDDAIYGLGDDVTRQGVFPSPFLTQADSELKLKLATAYTKRFGKQPNRLACLGFDALRLITLALSRNAQTREQLATELARTNGFLGAGGRVTFGEFRENLELPLYRIESGQAVPMGMAPLTVGYSGQ
jgi:branched-chain amino acid transport system substrate-binding protein